MSSQPTSVLSRPLLPASVAIFTSVALVAFEGTAVAAALPEVAADLGGVALLPWVITAFLFASGIATVIAGPMVDTLGTKRMFRWAVALFTVSGTVAAYAPTMPVMVAMRVLQGVGGGLLVAVGLAAVSLVYPDRLVGRAFAANATVWGVMGVAGPAIAAGLLTALDWRWIFLINLPLGGLSLAAGWKVLPGPVESSASSRVDGRGALLISVLTLAAIFAVDRLGFASAAFLALATIAGLLYWRHARHHPNPVVRLRHVAEQPFSGLALAIGLLLAGAFSANAYTTLYVSGGRGAGPGLTAWSVFFFTIGWTIGANASGRMLDRMAETSVSTIGFGFTVPAVGLVAPAAWWGAPLPMILGLLLFGGIGVGMSTNAALTLLRSVTPPTEIGRATAAHQFARNQGFTFGAALGGAVILLVVARAVGDVEVVQELLSTRDAAVSSETALAIAHGYAVVAMVGAVISAMGIIPMLSLRRHLADARRAKRGRRGAAGEL